MPCILKHMQRKANISNLVNYKGVSKDLKLIAEKVLNKERITFDEGVTLYQKGDLGLLGGLANFVREQKNYNKVFFNRNFHVEPTNLCVFTCKFCSYSRLIKQKDEGWVYSEDEIIDIIKSYEGQPVTEVHIVGGVLPQLNLEFFISLLKKIKSIRPDLHVKGYTAVELEYMFRKAKVSYSEGLRILKESGLDSMPGGGAEIFDEDIRNVICKDKCTTDQWLQIHEEAHKLGIPSNATMLYGHIENYEHRIDHMERLRSMQDRTGGFNTFIPLKFRNQNNEMSHIAEVSMIEDLKNYAISRIYMDNFNHIKAYWPMIGKTTAQLSLDFGVDDIDGTIDDSTKIYSMAGAEDQNPAMSTEELVEMIKQVNRTPIERDTLYNTIKDYSLEAVNVN